MKSNHTGLLLMISIWKTVAYDTIMNITFGSPLGFLDNAKDMYDLIANQVKHVAYVRVVMIPHPRQPE